MKFLVIEDDYRIARDIAAAIASLGDVTVFTCEAGFMPPMREAVAAIDEADFILLDGQLCKQYDGKHLLPICKGKKVLGISTQYNLGEYNWSGKDGFAIKNRSESTAAALREKVEKMLK